MFRRMGSAALFLLMLNVIALGDGLFSLDSGTDCAGQMANGSGGHQQGPASEGCNLPWAPGCAAAAACLPTALIVTGAPAVPARPERVAPLRAVFRAPAFFDAAPDHPPPRT